MDYLHTKKEIRNYILNKRAGLSQEERNLAEKRMLETICASEMFKEASGILCYVSFRDELSTHTLIKEALLKGKKVFVPKVMNKTCMEFYRIEKMEDLSEGYYGILEPTGREEMFQKEKDWEGKVLMIMPGAAFDHEGNRIGYGGGFYDRFLEINHKKIDYKVAIGFMCQEVESIPYKEHDVKADRVFLF